MNLSDLSVTAQSKVSVTPADATASGSFNLGLGARRATLDIDQLFTLKCLGVDYASIVLKTGVATVTDGDGNHTGGAGKDADGVTVALTELGVIHLRNTGETDIKINIPLLDGEVDVIAALPIKAGADFFYNSQSAIADGTLEVEPLVALEAISFDLCVMGKL